jgi:hypothetical protein
MPHLWRIEELLCAAADPERSPIRLPNGSKRSFCGSSACTKEPRVRFGNTGKNIEVDFCEEIDDQIVF